MGNKDLGVDTFATFCINLDTLVDANELELLGHFLQLSYKTTKLHATRAYRQCTIQQEADFMQMAHNELEGSVVHVLIDPWRLEPSQKIEECLEGGEISFDVARQLYETGNLAPPTGFEGNPTGEFKLLLFKAALGHTVVHTPEDGDHNTFLKRTIPESFNSLELNVNSEAKNYNSVYRFRSSQQLLLYALVEFEFSEVRVHVPEPICDICELEAAQWYCQADRAHLCDSCDTKHHSSSPIFARHKRVPSSKSPVQFGLCESHPTEVLDSICLQCCVALCNHCILYGVHSDVSYLDHSLMSTIDAYEFAIHKTSINEEPYYQRFNEISARIKNSYWLLSQIYSNFSSVQNRIESACKMLVGQLEGMRDRKIRYLEAIQHEAETEIFIIQWIESFLNHLLLSMGKDQFVEYKKKYDLLIAKLFNNDSRIRGEIEALPAWLSQQLTLTGEANVKSLSFDTFKVETEALTNDRIKGEWTPMNIYKNWKGEQIGVYMPKKNELLSLNNIEEVVEEAAMIEDRRIDDDMKEVQNSNIPKANRLWGLLSRGEAIPAFHLVKMSRINEQGNFIGAICTLADFFEDITNLFTSAVKFERASVSHEFGYCILMRSSSCLLEMLAHILFLKSSASQESLRWFSDVTIPFINSIKSIVKGGDKDTIKDAAVECVDLIIGKLEQSLDLLLLPSSLRFVIYHLHKAVAPNGVKLCVDMIGALLSLFIARNYGSSEIETLDGINEEREMEVAKEFVNEVSFVFSRVGMRAWDIQDGTQSEEKRELLLAGRLLDWVEMVMKRPRLESRLHTKKPNPSEINKVVDILFKCILKVEDEINKGTAEVGAGEVNRVTRDVDLQPIFELARS